MKKQPRPTTGNFIHRGIKAEIGREGGFPERFNFGEYQVVDWIGNTVESYDAKDVCLTFRFYPGTQTRPARLVEYRELARVARTVRDRAKDMAIGVAATTAVFYALNAAERVNALIAGL